MKVINEISDYRKYLSSKKSPGDSEFNLILATSKLEKALDDPTSAISKFLYNLDEYQKIELLRALIMNDKTDNFSKAISNFLNDHKVSNVNLENIIAINSSNNNQQWFNPLTMKIAMALMHNNKEEVLDDFAYARIVKAAISSVPDTVIGLHAKRNLIRQMNTRFDSKIIDPSKPYDLLNVNPKDTSLSVSECNQINTKFNELIKDISTFINTDQINKIHIAILPFEAEKIMNNKTLSSAEYLILSIGVLKNISGTNNIIDDKLKQIIQAYRSSNFSQANDLIKETCLTHANKLDLLSPNLSKKLIEQQNKLKLEQYYIDYVEPVEILNKSKSSGIIKTSELTTIEKSKKIDKSEYIMLAVGLLKNSSNNNPELEEKLKEIRHHYLATKYEAAIQLISDICNDPSYKIDEKTPRLSQRLIDLQDKCEEVNVMKNYTRRFFENRVGALYLGTEVNYDAINRIIKYFTPANFQPSTDAKQVFLQFINDKIVDPDKNNKELIDIMLRMKELQDGSDDFMKRGRALRDNIVNVEKELENDTKSGLEIFSKNKGAMKAMQPNYRDELSNATLRNPMPDIHTLSQKAGTYVGRNPRSAYVAAISGHTFFFVAMLEKYMQDNKDSPTLNNDVNHFLRGLAATYVNMGFHSILEVTHALETPMVKDIFQKYNVQYDPNFSDKVLEQAFNDAQAYNSQILLRTVMQDEIINRKNIFSMITEGKFNEIKALLSNGIDPNIRDEDNNTPLHIIASSEALTTEEKSELVNILIDKGADTDVLNNTNRTPLMDAIDNNLDNDIVIKLLNENSEISPRNDLNTPGRNVFERAMIFDNYDLAIKLLQTNKFDSNISIEVCGESFTPLTKAITSGTEGLDFFKALIKQNDVDVNKGIKGNIPIFLAIEENNLIALQALLNHHKIDLHLKNVSGLTVLQFAKEMNNDAAINLIESATKKITNKSSLEEGKNLSPSSLFNPSESLNSLITNQGPGRH